MRAGKKLWPFLCAGWIYTPPGSNGSQRVNNAFDSSYSEVMWVGRPRDGGKDITCKQVAPTRNVIVQCKRSNSKVDHGFLQGMKDKLKNVSRGTTFTNGIAAVFPGIRNRTEVLNILQEINDELRNNSKFILLEEWEITPLSEHSIQNKLKYRLKDQNLLDFFYERLDGGFPVGDDGQPLPFQAKRRRRR